MGADMRDVYQSASKLPNGYQIVSLAEVIKGEAHMLLSRQSTPCKAETIFVPIKVES
jgi:hypothetical protein